MIGSFGVEPVPVDERLLRRNPEHTRSGVAFLRQRRRAANLNDTGTQSKKSIRNLGVFVKSPRDSDWV